MVDAMVAVVAVRPSVFDCNQPATPNCCDCVVELCAMMRCAVVSGKRGDEQNTNNDDTNTR